MTERDHWKGRAGFDLEVRNRHGRILGFFHAAPVTGEHTMLKDFDETVKRARRFLTGDYEELPANVDK